MSMPRLAWLAPLFIALSRRARAGAGFSPSPDGGQCPRTNSTAGHPCAAADGFHGCSGIRRFRDLAAEYLDLRNLRGEASDDLSGPQLARRLHVIIMRATWLDVDELDRRSWWQGSTTGSRAIGIRSGSYWTTGKEIRLLMQKVPRGDGVFVWKSLERDGLPDPGVVRSSMATLSSIETATPEIAQRQFSSGMDLFKWVVMLAGAVFAYVRPSSLLRSANTPCLRGPRADRRTGESFASW